MFSSNKEMEIVYFDIDDLLNDLKSQSQSFSNELTLNEVQKESLISTINAKLFTLNPKKSSLILLDNFHYFFSTNELSKLSLCILNELLTIKKRQE